MGEERYNSYMEAFNEEVPTSIRLNTGVWPHGQNLHVGTCSHHQVPWCEEGFYLEGRPQFTFDPLFHAGCYYVQEAASMFVSHVLKSVLSSSSSGTAVEALDMCAAPGGKSTALLNVLSEDSLLVSNEPIPTRAQILLENITKWGAPNCIVTNNYPRDFKKAKAKVTVPSEAAEIIVSGMEAGKWKIIIGKDCKQMDLLTRLAPRFAMKKLAEAMKKLHAIK